MNDPITLTVSARELICCAALAGGITAIAITLGVWCARLNAVLDDLLEADDDDDDDEDDENRPLVPFDPPTVNKR